MNANGGKLQAVAFSAGNARILISQDDGSKGTDRAKGDGFSMMLTTNESVDEIAARIKLRGGTLDSEAADMMGRRAFRLRDPDGFRFAISSEQRS